MRIESSSKPHAYAGRSLIEMIMEQAVVKYGRYRELLDESFDGVKPDEEWIHENAILLESDSDSSHRDNLIEFWRVTGELNGVAYSVAKLRNHSNPNVKDVKMEIHNLWADQEEE